MRNNSNGFSLVELMVVVAIIGLLAAIAVPMYSKFQARARQSEAKANLSAIFSAEASFATEWGGYADSFVDIGYAPTGKVIYAIGFDVNVQTFCPQAYVVAHGFAGTICPSEQAPPPTVLFNMLKNSRFYCDRKSLPALGYPGNSCDMVAGVTGVLSAPLYGVNLEFASTSGFTASAQAWISKKSAIPFDPTALDVWTINSDKQFLNPQSGM